MLRIIENHYYRLKTGDTLSLVAKAYKIPECALIGLNGLTEEPWAGYLLKLPSKEYSLYTVQAGDSKKNLCGSEERYRALNFTDEFFIGMKILI